MQEYTVQDLFNDVMKYCNAVLKIKAEDNSEYFRFDKSFGDFLKEWLTTYPQAKTQDLDNVEIQSHFIQTYLYNHRIYIPDILPPDGRENGIAFYYSLKADSVEEAKKIYFLGNFSGETREAFTNAYNQLPEGSVYILVYRKQLGVGNGWLYISISDVKKIVEGGSL